MDNLIFKEVDKKDEKQVMDLIKVVLNGLERKEFFIPYEEWELEEFFNKDYALLHGAYDGEKLTRNITTLFKTRFFGRIHQNTKSRRI